MTWRTDDWEAFTAVATVDASEGLDADEAITSILRRIPGRDAKTVALIGGAGHRERLMLESEFGCVVSFDAPPADLAPFRGMLDAVLVPEPLPALCGAGGDDLLLRLHDSLVEGGLLIVAFPAIGRPARSLPMVPAPGEGLHELQAQFRLLRNGFQGVRSCRVPAEPLGDGPGEAIVCAAVRRAMN